MPSPRQLEANRRNAQLSSGPRTIDGKAVSRFNGLQHGLAAQQAVLRPDELEEFNCLRDSFLADLQPADAVEAFLVDRIILSAWRLSRCRRIEIGMLHCRLRDCRDTIRRDYKRLPGADLAYVYLSTHDTFRKFVRYESRFEKAFFRALHDLERRREINLYRPNPIPFPDTPANLPPINLLPPLDDPTPPPEPPSTPPETDQNPPPTSPCGPPNDPS